MYSQLVYLFFDMFLGNNIYFFLGGYVQIFVWGIFGKKLYLILQYGNLLINIELIICKMGRQNFFIFSIMMLIMIIYFCIF